MRSASIFIIPPHGFHCHLLCPWWFTCGSNRPILRYLFSRFLLLHDKAGDGEGKSDKPKKKDAVENADLSEFTDGAPIGAFVRIRLEGLPAACVAELRSERPIVLGGLASGETGMCEVQSKVKRHRWNPKLLKSNDAMLLSCGFCIIRHIL